jgi:hypothetical protein
MSDRHPARRSVPGSCRGIVTILVTAPVVVDDQRSPVANVADDIDRAHPDRLAPTRGQGPDSRPQTSAAGRRGSAGSMCNSPSGNRSRRHSSATTPSTPAIRVSNRGWAVPLISRGPIATAWRGRNR